MHREKFASAKKWADIQGASGKNISAELYAKLQIIRSRWYCLREILA